MSPLNKKFTVAGIMGFTEMEVITVAFTKVGKHKNP